MPSPEIIHAGLTEIANRYWYVASAWHVAMGLVFVTVFFRRTIACRTAALLMTAPLFSVAVFAFAGHNPFNGIAFALLAFALCLVGVRLDGRPAERAPWSMVAAGAAMIAFGWLYPHFLVSRSMLAYLFAAPTGLIPCPTLSVVIGCSLVLGGLSSRAWTGILVAAGLFYGLFGAFRLGVRLDFVLILGALVLGAEMLRVGARASRGMQSASLMARRTPAGKF